ncbi:MAG TPA: DEAD/DEAH box helicase [Candidatus Binatia bacterium]|nr:DEAD/DEAH box helicase [Candidatus Binatia bacterium]
MTEIPFHPLVRRWFAENFSAGPTAAQRAGWAHIAEGRATLIAAPTGSGKTLAAFLWSINRLVERGLAGGLEDRTSVVYVSPLKALGNDIEKNLRVPLAGIMKLAEAEGLFLQLPEIRIAVRSGDTPAAERQAMIRRPPHILITTPESLYILLTSENGRRILSGAETAIVDEIHALAGDKRGSHLALSLERLDALAEKPLQRIGLSATQKPIDEIARLLVGTGRIDAAGSPDCEIVDVGHRRELDLSIDVPEQELGPITSQDLWGEVYNRIVERVQAHRTTLIFVHTRRLVERVAHQLTSRLGEGKVGAHHGSLSRKRRLEVEEGLKTGKLPVVVASASLELGIDIGHVELVCHIGAPRNLASLLQRIGRSGHWLGAVPKGIFYPLTRDDLMQAAAAVRAVRAGALDRVTIPEKPLDILAQQMVATVASVAPSPKPGAQEESGSKSIGEEELFALMRRAYPYRDLTRREFDQVLETLAEGIAGRRGRRQAYIHRDQVHRRLRARRGARMAAITNGGAIPETADYDVIMAGDETFVGKVNEDFAIESLAGDIFLLGNNSWRIKRVAAGKVWVEDAHGLPPSIPFWLGESPGRSRELSAAVSELREEIFRRASDKQAAIGWLVAETGVPEAAAAQMIAYVEETQAMLGCVPTDRCVVAERFFDEAGGMQLVIHAPFGGRINRAWGLALRKRFCLNFDRELQAAATDDGMVLSLGEQHSFALADVFSMVRTGTLELELIQAALASPMFDNRWRWNAARSLALLRFAGGKKVPVALQRMRAEDLLGAVFPEQLMCGDNRSGPVEPPDHPLVETTIYDCLHEALDVDGLKEIVAALEAGKLKTISVDTPAPSPMAHEILNANPYAFLDDAPLEERRARAVSLRRTDPDLARGIGALSAAAIEQVRDSVRPDLRDPEELHDLLLSVGILPVERATEWTDWAEKLIAESRAAVASWSDGVERRAYVAAERIALVEALLPDARIVPPLSGAAGESLDREYAARKIVQGWLEIAGPTTATALAAMLGLPRNAVEQALFALEISGVVLRGEFTGSAGETEWCERVLLARIHRLTLGELRREIEPVTAADLMRFLFRWQHIAPGTQLHGRAGVEEIVGQLQGLELPAPAWEQHVLPARVANYDPRALEELCLGGVVSWGRLRPNVKEDDANAAPARKRRRRQSPGRAAPISFALRDDLHYFLPAHNGGVRLSGSARAALEYLEKHGASFLTDVARGAGLLKAGAEAALWELVAAGLVTGDGIAGLRTLLLPESKRQARRRLRIVSGGRSPERLMPIGRWSLWHTHAAAAEESVEFITRQLLRRYGVVLRELLARESAAPSWRSVLDVCRRLEARGEIRGGRFVNGFVGQQFALPEAVEVLRAIRREKKSETILVSAADPLNLAGILTPGPRVSPYSGLTIAFADGMPADIGPLGAVLSKLGQIQAAAEHD